MAGARARRGFGERVAARREVCGGSVQGGCGRASRDGAFPTERLHILMAALVEEQAQRMLLAARARRGRNFMPVSQEDRIGLRRLPPFHSSQTVLRMCGFGLVVGIGAFMWLSIRKGVDASERPHILLIEADQVRPDAHAIGGSAIAGLTAMTPNIDSIAAEGVRFTRAYSSTPICTPARFAILTGRSPARHGMRSYQPQVPLSNSKMELVSTLASNGYHTAIVGKNHYGFDLQGNFALHGFVESSLYEGLLSYDSRVGQRFVRADDYGRWFNHSCPGCDPLATRQSDESGRSAAPWREAPGATPYNSYEVFVYPYAEKLHPTRWTADAAIQAFDRWYHRRQTGDDHSLFLKVSFHRPHSPLDPPERWMRYMLDRSHLIAAPAMGNWEEDFFHSESNENGDKYHCSAGVRRYCGGNCGFQSYCGRPTASETRAVRAAYLASLSFVDEQAGRLLQRIKSSSEVWQNTFVFYLSDHGDALGDHDLWRKGYPFEQVASVPFYVRWPTTWESRLATSRGSVVSSLVELRDVFPTIADVAGIVLPPADASEAPDGSSIISLLRHAKPPPSWRDVLILELATCERKGRLDNFMALTDGHGKYVRHLTDGREQLFDLASDAYEQRDLARANRSAVQSWRARLAAELLREGRGAKWVTPTGSLPIARECSDYEQLDVAAASRDSRSENTQVPTAPLANIVFFLSDDQDLMLGGAGFQPMRETHRLLVERGATASNFFAHTPICGPSRAQILTGRYLHNLKWDATVTQPRPPTERNCMHINTSLVHDHSFAPHLKKAGYTVGLFGKYLNWPADWKHVPDGFSAWFANGGGDYLSPRFFSKHLGALGYPDGDWQGLPTDYSTSVIGNVSTAWIESVSSSSRPFFAYIGVKAAHEPFTPAPWYANHWDATWPKREPRTPNWNCSYESRKDHHGCIAEMPMLNEAAESVITGAFKNRWRTLLSLDDLVLEAYAACERAGVLQHTYFISTSDHGYQLGQFNILMDKRHVYDWDTRVPFIIRGPGISAGVRFEEPATLADLAPTFLSIAGIPKPTAMDGKSVLPLLVDETSKDLWAELSPAAQRHLQQLGTRESVRSKWRKGVLLAHFFFTENTKCVSNCSACSSECTRHDSNCADAHTGTTCWATLDASWAQDPLDCTLDCYPTETRENNFVAVRHTQPGKNTLYAVFQRGNLDEGPVDFSTPSHIELFDAADDPWMMNNLHGHSSLAREEEALHEELLAYMSCKGHACP